MGYSYSLALYMKGMKHTRGQERNTVSNGDAPRRVSMESDGVDGKNRRSRNEQVNRQQETGSSDVNDAANRSSATNGSVPQHGSSRSALGNDSRQQSNSVVPGKLWIENIMF